jgi:redox-sensitive bicupin YhaK (pirin superfamily)
MQRKIKEIFEEKPTLEGAGVRLNRVFGYRQIPIFDPFLLFDHFGSDNPEDYIKGFPWHPHRGMETVTYMLSGEVEHGDSIGNKGIIGAGDIQWMTAGSGIIHQEMPIRYNGLLQGFQLWVNLPKKNKMINPRYQGIIDSQIPIVKKNGLKIKLIAGEIDGYKGPVKDLIVDVEYFDVTLDNEIEFKHHSNIDHNVFLFVISGRGIIFDREIKQSQCVLLNEGEDLIVKSIENLNFLLISGRPLNEPIAWGGPIVMNYKEELNKAFSELNEGNFIKNSRKISTFKDYYSK